MAVKDSVSEIIKKIIQNCRENDTFLAPLAVGQRAYVIACCVSICALTFF